jgi:hypothetical protein
MFFKKRKALQEARRQEIARQQATHDFFPLFVNTSESSYGSTPSETSFSGGGGDFGGGGASGSFDSSCDSGGGGSDSGSCGSSD